MSHYTLGKLALEIRQIPAKKTRQIAALAVVCALRCIRGWTVRRENNFVFKCGLRHL